MSFLNNPALIRQTEKTAARILVPRRLFHRTGNQKKIGFVFVGSTQYQRNLFEAWFQSSSITGETEVNLDSLGETHSISMS